MNRTFAFGVSAVFHPVFVNLLSLLTLIFLCPILSFAITPQAKLYYIVFVFVTTGIIPILFILLYTWLGRIQSILLDVQHERNIPYLITASLYLFNYYIFSKTGAPPFIIAYVIGCACVVVAVAIINHFYKISAHGASLGALTGILLAISSAAIIDMRLLLAFVIVISGLTLSARLFLAAHTLPQVLLGWILGLSIMYLIF